MRRQLWIFAISSLLLAVFLINTDAWLKPPPAAALPFPASSTYSRARQDHRSAWLRWPGAPRISSKEAEKRLNTLANLPSIDSLKLSPHCWTLEEEVEWLMSHLDGTQAAPTQKDLPSAMDWKHYEQILDPHIDEERPFPIETQVLSHEIRLHGHLQVNTSKLGLQESIEVSKCLFSCSPRAAVAWAMDEPRLRGVIFCELPKYSRTRFLEKLPVNERVSCLESAFGWLKRHVEDFSNIPKYLEQMAAKKLITEAQKQSLFTYLEHLKSLQYDPNLDRDQATGVLQTKP